MDTDLQTNGHQPPNGDVATLPEGSSAIAAIGTQPSPPESAPAPGSEPEPADDQQNNPSAVTRDAIIFIPGIHINEEKQSVEEVAQRMAVAIDRNAVDARQVFTAGNVSEEEYAMHSRTRVCTIFRKNGEPPQPVIDVYEMDYHDALIGRYSRRSLLGKAVVLLLAILSVLPRFLFTILNRGKTLREKVQILISLAVFLLLIVQTGIVVYAAGDIVIQKLTTGGNNPSQQSVPTPPPVKPPQLVFSLPPINEIMPRAQQGAVFVWAWVQSGWEEFVNKWLQQIALVLLALGLTIPAKGKIREAIENMSNAYVAMIFYLNWGECRNILTGQLRDLLDHVKQKQDINYRRVHVVSYSFGSIIAIDALFPPGYEHTGQRQGLKPGIRFASVGSLTTIGSPFDYIRTFWPDYFEDRFPLAQAPAAGDQQLSMDKYWLNIYSPDDIYGSNFRNDAEIGPAEWTINNPGSRIFKRRGKPRQLPIWRKLRNLNQLSSGQPVPTSLDESEAVQSDSKMIPLPMNVPWITRISKSPLGVTDIITFAGLRAHSMYWENADESQISCFDAFVTHVYGEGDDVLYPTNGQIASRDVVQ